MCYPYPARNAASRGRVCAERAQVQAARADRQWWLMLLPAVGSVERLSAGRLPCAGTGGTAGPGSGRAGGCRAGAGDPALVADLVGRAGSAGHRPRRGGEWVRIVWVTGVSGAGKSAVSRRLVAFGYEAVSTDSAPGLCRWVDDAGRPAVRPGDPDLAWLATHRWVWDPARLDLLLASARERGVQRLFLCGHAANALELAARFDLTVLLRIDLATMLARLDHPARGNDFGRVGHSRQHLIEAFPQWQAHLQRHADVVVDATADLDTVMRKVAHAAGDTV